MSDRTGDGTPPAPRQPDNHSADGPTQHLPAAAEQPTAEQPTAEQPPAAVAAPGDPTSPTAAPPAVPTAAPTAGAAAAGPAAAAGAEQPTAAEHASPPPPAGAPPSYATYAPVGALPPRESRWGRRARSRPFQVIAAGLVGLLLGAGLATAASAALFFHGHRHGARFSQPGPGFDGRDGGVPGGGQWYDRRQGPGRPNMRMPRRNRLPNGQFPGNPGDPGNPGNPTPPSPPAAPSEAPSPSASPSI